MKLHCLFTIFLSFSSSRSEFSPEKKWEDVLNARFGVSDPPPLRSEVGEPLLLSPYLERDEVALARDMSEVSTEDMLDGIDSHAGYINVDKEYNSNLWFWYFPAQYKRVDQTPLVIWLQGGPGASSLFGLFEELGPFSVSPDATHLIENPHSWHKNYSLLFIDNPVGTGFSFTESKDGYTRNQTQIGEHLYIFMDQFLRIFPELKDVPLYISGESYAGKHIPSLAYQIHKNNPTAERKINLQGLAIGNGFIDPPTMMAYSSYVEQLGLADHHLVQEMKGYEKEAEAAMEQNDLTKAYKYFTYALGTYVETSKMYNVYNYVYDNDVTLFGPFTKFIGRPEIRRALHVGRTKFNSIGEVYRKLVPDFMGSAKPWLEELLNHYKVLAYSGQMDVIVAYPLSIRTYRSMKWNASEEYQKAERKPWYHGKILAGYVKTAGLLQEVMVRNAGHMVPTDQPERAVALLTAFINNTPLPDSPPEEDENTGEESKKDEEKNETPNSKIPTSIIR